MSEGTGIIARTRAVATRVGKERSRLRSTVGIAGEIVFSVYASQRAAVNAGAEIAFGRTRNDEGMRGNEPTYACTETPAKESTASPRTGWPKTRAGSKTLKRRRSSNWERVRESSGPETIR